MGEFLLELLGAILEPLLEALLEYLFAVIAELLVRSFGEVFTESRMQRPWLAHIGYGLFGIIFGTVSLTLFPHRLVRASRIHGLSLLISPLIVGLMMWATGMFLRRKEKEVIQLENFGYGFAFAFGIAAVRFLFAK
ncbi:MAG TPA: hypothetical protein VFR84_10505 [Candidatus Angelobacter sp.]|nr:hypothetical protein [Candidatus Angelobacter sp.]